MSVPKCFDPSLSSLLALMVTGILGVFSLLPTPPAIAATPSRTTAVLIYRANSQCTALVSQKVFLPADQALDKAVGLVLQNRNTSDFSISSYRVTVNSQGLATVDLRPSGTTTRKLESLSPCELFALFGSLRNTLMNNGQWKIQEVRFTERGQEIYL